MLREGKEGHTEILKQITIQIERNFTYSKNDIRRRFWWYENLKDAKLKEIWQGKEKMLRGSHASQ